MTTKARIISFVDLPTDYQKALICDVRELANSTYKRYEFKNLWEHILLQAVFLAIISLMIFIANVIFKKFSIEHAVRGILIIFIILMVGATAFLRLKMFHGNKVPFRPILLLTEKDLVYFHTIKRIFMFPFNLLTLKRDTNNNLIFSAGEFYFLLDTINLQSAVYYFQSSKNIPANDDSLSRERIFNEFVEHLLSRGSCINI